MIYYYITFKIQMGGGVLFFFKSAWSKSSTSEPVDSLKSQKHLNMFKTQI